MARKRTLNEDIRVEWLNYLVRQGSIPASATGFYKACEDKIDGWVKVYARDAVFKSIKGVWRAKPRSEGGGLRKLEKAKKPFPEVLILPKFMDGHHRKILTRFANVRHVVLDSQVKQDNAEMIRLALQETEEMRDLAIKAADGNLDVWITAITVETVDPIPPVDDDDDEDGDDEE